MFSRPRRILRHVLGAVALITALAFAGTATTQPAFAQGGSDSPTPYTVDLTGITLPSGSVFQDNGHVNIRTTGNKSPSLHFESKCINRTDAECAGARHEAAQYIGKSFIPWSAFGVDINTECVEWVQISTYNEHFGEGGQAPVGVTCSTPEPPEFPGVEAWTPTWESTCETMTFSHPEFRIASTQTEPESYTYQVVLNGMAGEVLAYTPNTVITVPFADKHIKNTFEVTLWAHYADGKPFEKQQLGKVEGSSTPCEEPLPEPKVIVPNPPQFVDFCGIENDELQLPSDTDDYYFTVEEQDDGIVYVTAHARDNVVFLHGEDTAKTLTWSFQFSDTPCDDDTDPPVDPPVDDEDPPVTPPTDPPVDKPVDKVDPPVKSVTPVVKTTDTKTGVLATTGSNTPMLAAAAIALLMAGGVAAGTPLIRRARNS